MPIVSRFAFVLGTDHRLQGAESMINDVVDPYYSVRLKQIISSQRIDCIFEEASERGPTTAERLAASINLDDAIGYLDVDPAGPKRYKFGIVTSTGQPFPIDESEERDEEKVGLHAQREELWIKRIVAQDFESGLVICGCIHTLSVAIRLRSAGLGVKFDTYVPFDKLCSHPNV